MKPGEHAAAGPPTMPVSAIIAVCLAALVWTRFAAVDGGDAVFRQFGLSREALAGGRWYALLTHAFLHGGVWHALFNLAGVWVLGRHLIREHGSVFFLSLLAAGILAGGMAQLALAADGILIGISGGVMALLTCAGFLWDDRRIAFGFRHWSIGNVQGRYLGWGVLLASCLFVLASPLFPEGGIAIGHACHAGAASAGAVVAWIGRRLAPVG